MSLVLNQSWGPLPRQNRQIRLLETTIRLDRAGDFTKALMAELRRSRGDECYEALLHSISELAPLHAALPYTITSTLADEVARLARSWFKSSDTPGQVARVLHTCEWIDRARAEFNRVLESRRRFLERE